MKRELREIAEYNAKAMDAALEALAKAPAELRAKDCGAYYKSLDGIVEHMAWAEALWLQRFASFGSYACLSSSPVVTRPLDELKREAAGDGDKAAALLREASALLRRFVDELPEPEFERRVSYRSTDGKEMVRTYWHAIFQVLNHGTHHRGEISAILDMHGLPNDYNSFVAYMP